jgi:F-type H+-transporting ATPase subunit b
MKFSGFSKKRVAFSIIMAVLVLFCYAGSALGSSDGEGGEVHGKQWDVKLSTGEKDWTDTYRVMNFAVLAIALFFVLRKPVSQALNGRIKDIQNQLSDLEEKKKEAENKLAEYDKKIATLDQEAEKIIAEYVKQGQEAHKKILEESKKEAEKLEYQAKRKIEHEFTAAKKQLQAEILEKALAKAEGLVKEKITIEDQDRLVDEYLDKVVVQ